MITSNPAHLSRDPGDVTIVAAAQGTSWAQSSAARRAAKTSATNKAKKDAQFTPETQPRDPNGRFRRILARLKTNLGDKATEGIAKKIESAEVAQVAGNYEEMRIHGGELIEMIDAVQDGQLAQGTVKNLRNGARDLGKVMAYLPLPQGNPNAKIRFSDMPPASANMVREMIKRVEEKLSSEDAAKYTKVLKEYMAGSRTMTSDEMASNLNKLLRVLA